MFYSLCLSLGSYFFSNLCPELYLLIFSSMLSSFLPLFVAFLRGGFFDLLCSPCSLPCPPPALPPLPKHLCVWQVREQRHSPGAPPLLFLLLFLSSFFFRWCCPSLTLSHLPLPHRQPPPPSPLYSVNLFALSPSGSHLSLHLCSFLFLYISLLTLLLTSVKLPLLPSHLSSVLLFKPSPLLSSPVFDSTCQSHFSGSLLFLPLFLSLVPPLTSNIHLFSHSSLRSFLFLVRLSQMLAITRMIFWTFTSLWTFQSIYLSLIPICYFW